MRDGRPPPGFAADMVGKLVRAAGERFEPLLAQRFVRFRRPQRLRCGLGKLFNDRPRLAGRALATFSPASTVIGQIAAGKLRPLATATHKRA
ncbi:MAG: hypothetical protein WAL37_08630 [Xanthobacteraceae bacterium]